jgi:serine phosphatase RsbU (regulator of sigma subunit)
MLLLIPGEIATMCLLSVDITSGHVRLANAGHPPPMWRPASGRPSLITGHSPLLGIRARPAIEIEMDLGPDDTLVLYTDGLIETREDELGRGFERLMKAAGTVERDLEVFASRLLADVGPKDPTDDIAMVALRRVAARPEST